MQYSSDETVLFYVTRENGSDISICWFYGVGCLLEVVRYILRPVVMDIM
jgi:hypothetical protein